MTCFWDGIIREINEQEFKNICDFDDKPVPIRFILFLKSTNPSLKNILWNGKKLTDQEIKEHLEAINIYNVIDIDDGHLCSTCDSFLLVISEIFKFQIIHKYVNTEIIYENNFKNNRTIYFNSNKSHFH